MNSGIEFLLLYVLVLSSINVVHGLSHLITASLSKVVIDRVSLGFGPTFWSAVKRGVTYRVAIPIGLFVRLKPSPKSSEQPSIPDGWVSYPDAGLGRKLLVAASPLFGIALFCFVIAFLHAGLPSFEFATEPAIHEVYPGSPAETAGLLPNDRITRIDGRDISDFEDLQKKVTESQGDALMLSVMRDGKTLEIAVSPEQADSTGGYRIGIIPTQIAVPAPPILPRMKNAVVHIIGFAEPFSFEHNTTLGPVMIGVLDRPMNTESEKTAESIRVKKIYFDFALLVSMHMLLLCLFPTPFLDGRRILFALIYGAIKRPVIWRVEWWYDRIFATPIILLNAATLVIWLIE